MFKKLLLILCIFVPVVAQAEWIKVYKTSEYYMYLSNDHIIETNENLKYVDFWVKSIIHTDLTKDGLSVGDHTMNKWSGKCKTKEMGLVAINTYKNNKILDSHVSNYPSFEPAIPDTAGEVLLEIACQVVEDRHNTY